MRNQIKLPKAIIMRIKIADLENNPYRNIKVHPICAEHVETLKESIEELGMPAGSLLARKHPTKTGKYQIAYGHHRRAAAKKAGMEELDVTVQSLADDQMRRWLILENSTQRGQIVGAVMSSVLAVYEWLTEPLRTMDSENVSKTFGTIFPDKASAGNCKAKFLKSGIIGEDILERACSNTITRGQIRAATNLLNDGGHLAKYAPKAVLDPKAKKAVKVAKPKSEATFDTKVTEIFDTPEQADHFREAVTTEASRKYIPVDQQKALAEHIVNTARENKNEQGNQRSHKPITQRLTGPYIASAVQTEVRNLSGVPELTLPDIKIKDDKWSRCVTAIRSANSYMKHVSNATDWSPPDYEVKEAVSAVKELLGNLKNLSKRATIKVG